MCKLWGPCQIIIFVYLMREHQGWARRPVVTVTPNWNKILAGENITMTCDVESNTLGYSWYHNNTLIYTGKDYVISVADIRHTGDYQCRANAGERSENVTLSVTNGQVIFQAPVYIYEGDNISLRCYSPHPAIQTIFYKNNQKIQNLSSDLLHIKYTDLSANYSCSKEFLRASYSSWTDETDVTYSEGRSVVVFTPQYNKLLTGENITMTFNGRIAGKYRWYKDNKKLGEGTSYTITSAQLGHSGSYQSRTKNGETATFRLDVSDGPVILQAPPLMYRGSDLVLRCHSRPAYRVINTTFYRGDQVLQPSPRDPSRVIIPANHKLVGKFKCMKTLSSDEHVTYTDEASLHIRELFTKPNISIVQSPVTEGDIIRCNTSLLKQGTELHFTFYRDGQKVNSSGDVLYVGLEDSGNYSCEVRTPTNTVRKRSEELYIHIQELFPKPNLTASHNPGTTGAPLTLTCNTERTQRTELRFAFYRDGLTVRNFSSSHQYDVNSAQLGDSGNYSCEVTTSTERVKKMSGNVSIHIHEYERSSTATLVSVSVIAILLLVIILLITFLVVTKRWKPSLLSASKKQKESQRSPFVNGDICYADIRINQKAPAADPAASDDLCYVNFTTSKAASSPKVAQTVIYSEIKPRTEI